MCAYAPGTHYNPGPIGHGIASGMGQIADAMLQNAQKREEKERWAKTVEKLQPIIDQQTGGKVRLDKDTPKEAIPSIMQFADNLEREQREAPLRAIQMENEKLRQRISQQELEDAAGHAAALPEAAKYLQTGDALTAFTTYTAKGGRNARTLAELGDLARAQMAAGAKPKPIVFASEKDLAARYPADKYDYKMVPDAETGNVRVENLSPRAPQNTLPPGYEPDPAKAGAIRPIAGSEGDMKRQEMERTTGNRLQDEIIRADVILNAVNQVLPKVDGFTSGFAGTALNKIAGTEAKDVGSLIDTIKANIGFEQLQRMREASPTGGALGNVAIKELEYLQAAMGNLSTSQSPARLRKTLGEVRDHYDRWRKAASGVDPDGEEARSAPAPAGAAAPAMTADQLAAKWLKKK